MIPAPAHCPEGNGRQRCRHCSRKSVASLRRGAGLCPFHWAVFQWGAAWAEMVYR